MPKKNPKRYNGKFYKYVPSAIFGLAGLFYILSPYQIKLATGLDFGSSPDEHIIFGVVFLGISVAFYAAEHVKKAILP